MATKTAVELKRVQGEAEKTATIAAVGETVKELDQEFVEFKKVVLERLDRIIGGLGLDAKAK